MFDSSAFSITNENLRWFEEHAKPVIANIFEQMTERNISAIFLVSIDGPEGCEVHEIACYPHNAVATDVVFHALQEHRSENGIDVAYDPPAAKS